MIKQWPANLTCAGFDLTLQSVMQSRPTEKMASGIKMGLPNAKYLCVTPHNSKVYLNVFYDPDIFRLNGCFEVIVDRRDGMGKLESLFSMQKIDRLAVGLMNALPMEPKAKGYIFECPFEDSICCGGEGWY